MSRSVSAPSSVTKTSPCWNGLIVPGSTFKYGSNFWSCTRSPRALSRRPSDAATIPFPSAETTPPVTKMYLGARALTGFQGSRHSGRRTASGASRPAARVHSPRRSTDAREELLAAQHPLDLLAALLLAESRDARMSGVASDLLDAEVAVGERRNLRQVGDRDHLRPLCQPTERTADGVGGLAADARIDLVEHHRLAARDGGNRQRHARELSSGGGLGDGAERQTRVRPDQERRLVATGRAGLALAQLDEELAVAHPHLAQLGGHRVGERRSSRIPLGGKLRRQPPHELLGRGELLRARDGGIEPVLERRELLPRVGRTREEPGVVGAAKASL